MRNLINLIFRFSALITFLIFEFVSLYLIVTFNKSQGEIWAHSSNLFSGTINKNVQVVEDFFTLKSTNDSLLTQNARLLQSIINYRIYSENNKFQQFESVENDSLINYSLIPANIISKSVNLRNNYLTLNAGSAQNVEPGMGVVSATGVIGIIKSVSENFSTVLMILNNRSRISCKIVDKDFNGNLVWRSNDPLKMSMLDVPKHANIEIGDKVVTNGYSISFPPNIQIGTITNFEITGGSNSYIIEVSLDYDLSNVRNAYIVNFGKSDEKENLISTQDE